jgi:crossover junction endodeoxyribonuclease RuvC
MGISPKQFAALESRVGGKRRVTEEGHALDKKRIDDAPPKVSTVLGLDPSLRGTGWGVVRMESGRPVVAACGTIVCKKTWSRSRCLGEIATTLREVARVHGPGVCAVEGLFFAQNLQTALIMGEARGAAMAVLAEAMVPIYEIAPRKVKQAMVGYGAAQKLAVAKMVQRMTGLTELPSPDAADALALALVYLQEAGRPLSKPMKRI